MPNNTTINKVIVNGVTKIDLTGDTAIPSDVALGKTFHDATGAQRTGSFDISVIFDMIYPVGSIYMSVSNTSPAVLFGGTWESIGQGKTLVGVDTNDTDYDTVEKTGGSKTKTLDVANLPAHNHTASSSSSSTSTSTFTGTSASTDNSASLNHRHSITCYGHNASGTNVGGLKTGGGTSSTGYTGYSDLTHKHTFTAKGTVKTTTTTTTTTTVNNTGSGTAFDVKNPYYTVYMWKRTA